MDEIDAARPRQPETLHLGVTTVYLENANSQSMTDLLQELFVQPSSLSISFNSQVNVSAMAFVRALTDQAMPVDCTRRLERLSIAGMQNMRIASK